MTEIFGDFIEGMPPKITLNLRQLEFLNSSGISMLSKFVIKVRQKKMLPKW